MKFPVPVMYKGMKIRKIRYQVPVSKSTFRSYPTWLGSGLGGGSEKMEIRLNSASALPGLRLSFFCQAVVDRVEIFFSIHP